MILDTNALSAYLDRMAEAVEVVSEAPEIEIPVVVAGELVYGISQSRRRAAYERSLQRMLDRCTVFDIGIDTARHYATIRLELRFAGTPIPANDVWIAALSRRHAMPVRAATTAAQAEYFNSVLFTKKQRNLDIPTPRLKLDLLRRD